MFLTHTCRRILKCCTIMLQCLSPSLSRRVDFSRIGDRLLLDRMLTLTLTLQSAISHKLPQILFSISHLFRMLSLISLIERKAKEKRRKTEEERQLGFRQMTVHSIELSPLGFPLDATKRFPSRVVATRVYTIIRYSLSPSA